MIVVGIDPGTRKTGWASLDLHQNGQVMWLDSDTITTHAKKPAERLCEVFYALRIIGLFPAPNVVAIESGYFGLSGRTGLALAEMRGVCMLVGALYKADVQTYAPAEVKRAVTGKGNADKETVRAKVSEIVGRTIESYDEADAIAVALTAIKAMGRAD